jgi:nucleoside diphosphate kinase
MKEKTLIIIKPEAVSWGNSIFNHLDAGLQLARNGEIIKRVTVESVPREIAEAHCGLHRQKDFFYWLVNQYLGKTVELGVCEGEEGLIKTVRQIVGHRDPVRAREEKFMGITPTIRGVYSSRGETEALAREQKRGTRNAIHSSASVLEAYRELKVWESYLGQSANWPEGEKVLTELYFVLSFLKR